VARVTFRAVHGGSIGTLRSFTNLIAIVCVLHRRGVPVIAGAD
jgi:hypothetical protein